MMTIYKITGQRSATGPRVEVGYFAAESAELAIKEAAEHLAQFGGYGYINMAAEAAPQA